MVTRPDLLVGGDWSWFVVPDADLFDRKIPTEAYFLNQGDLKLICSERKFLFRYTKAQRVQSDPGFPPILSSSGAAPPHDFWAGTDR
jgi:hypothetical protein